jgi:hypothetical protein
MRRVGLEADKADEEATAPFRAEDALPDSS